MIKDDESLKKFLGRAGRAGCSSVILWIVLSVIAVVKINGRYHYRRSNRS